MRRKHPPGPAVQRRRAFVRAGFSLIELIVVMAVIGVVAAMVVPRWGGSLARSRVNAAANRIAADIRLARAHARASSAETTVEFDSGKGFYIIPAIPDPRTKSGVMTVDLSADPYRVTIVSANFGGDASARYNAFGYIQKEGKVEVSAGSYSCTVTLRGASGEPEIP